jgi:hypothetical protein
MDKHRLKRTEKEKRKKGIVIIMPKLRYKRSKDISRKEAKINEAIASQDRREIHTIESIKSKPMGIQYPKGYKSCRPDLAVRENKPDGIEKLKEELRKIPQIITENKPSDPASPRFK